MEEEWDNIWRPLEKKEDSDRDENNLVLCRG